MGGSVGAESEPGKGSTFWLEVPLPRAPAGGAETRSDRTGDARPARERSALLILVVEDTPVNRAVASGLLVKCGFMAHTANNGSEALEAISTDSYDAVLMDCQMPVMDGYEATREIRRRERGGKRRIPIIAMTANSTEAERQRCLAVGMDDFLSKPLRKQLLEETLERWLTASSTGTPEAGAPGPDTATARLGATRWELLDDEVLAELEALGEGMLGELLSEYFDGVERDLAELDTVIGRGEAFTAARIAHRLKGGSATIGARRVSELAADLEATAKAGDDRSAAALLDVIRSSLRETRAALLDRGLSTR
jgi:CheY-like chemotaxis protein/HPt (histidine-containing phosphotransfer) domain-containing protein